MNQDKKKVTLMGLYEKVDKNGNQFFTGKLGMSDVLVFKNTKKKSEKSPDFWVYAVERDQEQKPAPSEDDGFNF